MVPLQRRAIKENQMGVVEKLGIACYILFLLAFGAMVFGLMGWALWNLFHENLWLGAWASTIVGSGAVVACVSACSDGDGPF